MPRTSWEHRLQELLDFRRINGHVNVPRTWSLNPRLANWVNNQRRLLRLGLLGKARIRRLEEFGIGWEGEQARRQAQQETWDRMFGSLRAYRRSCGNLEVPRGWPAEPSLAAWLTSQRYLWRSGTISEERASRLRELDAEWHRPKSRASASPKPRPSVGRREAAWEQRCAALTQFRKTHGHCEVPARWVADPKLAQWVILQRVQRRRGELSAERFSRLDALGFVWSGLELKKSRQNLRWEERFEALSAFAAEHGHCCAPARGATDSGLAAWVFRQRHERRLGKLSEDRIGRLDRLRFEWTLPKNGGAGRAQSWETRFAELQKVARKSGGIDAVDRKRWPGLHEWLLGQRRRQRKGLIDPELARRLESAGIVWSVRASRWEARYAQLLEYRRRRGDCRVEMGAGADRGLARWVSAQRTAKKTGSLSATRLKLLEAAGFIWSAAGIS